MFYLDNASTTPVFPDALKKALPYLTEHFGNPSSVHLLGVNAARAVKEARNIFCKIFHVPQQNVIFTGSGTESNQLAIWGTANSPRMKGDQILFSSIEHPSVLNSVEDLRRRGFNVELIKVLPDGIVDMEHLETLLSEKTRMVSVMAINNEIGTCQPLEDIGLLVRNKCPNAVFHVDAAQALTKMPLSLKNNCIDLLTINGHKIGAPKGIGALILSKSIPLESILKGGGQENNLRSGTENVFGIVAFAEAMRAGEKDRDRVYKLMTEYNQKWRDDLASNCPDIFIYSSPYISPYYLNLALPPVPAEVFLHHLEAEDIYVSTGSACSSRKNKISYTLKAIKLKDSIANSLIRMSFSGTNLNDSYDKLFGRFQKVVNTLMEFR